jgi:hypothetical protein
MLNVETTTDAGMRSRVRLRGEKDHTLGPNDTGGRGASISRGPKKALSAGGLERDERKTRAIGCKVCCTVNGIHERVG